MAAKQLLEQYNTAAYGLSSSDPLPSLQDILLPQSDFWSQNATNTDSGIAWKMKEEIIQASLLIQQCEEEIQMLKSDMIETVRYLYNRITCITNKIQELESPGDPYLSGVKCVLQRLKQDNEVQHHRATNMFSKFVTLPTTVTMECIIDSSAISEQSDDDDSDIESESSDSEVETL